MSVAELLDIVLMYDYQVFLPEIVFGQNASTASLGRGLCLVSLPATTTVSDDIAGTLMY